MLELRLSFVLSLALGLTLGTASTGCKSDAAPATPVPTGAADPAPAAGPGQAQPADLAAVLAGDHRSAENRARDPFRHPQETLEFFGIRPEHTVVELWPGGGGWYTEILAPWLRERGKLIVTNFDTSGPPDSYGVKSGLRFNDKLTADPSRYNKVEVVTVKDPNTLVLGPDGSADAVLTFRNTHGWVGDGIEAGVYQAVFRVLKPGGVFGVVAHRAKPGPVADVKAQAKTGYLPQDWVVARVESFGFKLAEASEINANPKDTADHADGVWALPPALRGGDKDRDKYTAIGESDRMTLKFIKP